MRALPMAGVQPRTVTDPQRAMIEALRDPRCYPHPVATIRVVETHISWVILTGNFAYKIKKPVNLGFLDFTSLERRRYYCEEELRLNRRLAPDLYLEVACLRGTPESPRFGIGGPALEYAVKMREFPQEALAARLIKGGELGPAAVDALADRIAWFHAAAPAAKEGERYGSAGTVLGQALQNFRQTLPWLSQARDKAALRTLEQWTVREFGLRRAAFQERHRQGFVRECHGDLHLGNVAVINDAPVPFDCIEFNEDLRWIDVVSEAAFLFMDLEDRRHAGLAWRFLNRYLAATGDYGGLEVFRFYVVYRALVRAKVHLMRSRQPGLRRTEKARLAHVFQDYLRLASRLAAQERVALILAHGLSGCGKTTLTQPLVEALGAVRLRSDLERKRLHGFEPLATSGSGLENGIYTPGATAATYRRLGELAQGILGAGYPVVVDATFLKRTEREGFRSVAERLDAPFLILDFHAPQEVLRTRVAERLARADDASEADLAVLKHQFAAREPLTPAEMEAAFAVDATVPVSHDMWRPFIERFRRSAIGKAPVARTRTAGPDNENNA